MKNRAGDYHFPGRYTLMNIAGTWNVYDREKGQCAKSLSVHTFVKAERELMKFKAEVKDNATK